MCTSESGKKRRVETRMRPERASEESEDSIMQIQNQICSFDQDDIYFYLDFRPQHRFILWSPHRRGTQRMRGSAWSKLKFKISMDCLFSRRRRYMQSWVIKRACNIVKRTDENWRVEKARNLLHESETEVEKSLEEAGKKYWIKTKYV